MTKCVLITGASTGIGLVAAEYFYRQGWNVAASMRDPETNEALVETDSLMRLRLDVTDSASIEAAVAAVLERWGQIDVLVNNAGFGLVGPFEAAEAKDIQRQFEVNVFGLMAVTRAVLPGMRARGGGTVVNISSMAGYSCFPYYSLYHASKWAVEGFTESLRYELQAFGIRLKLVEPGVVNTDFYTRSKTSVSLPEYEPVAERSFARMEQFQKLATPCEKVVSIIYRAATDNRAKLRYPVGWDASLLYVLRLITPDCVLRRLIRLFCLG